MKPPVGEPRWYLSSKRRPFISVYPDNTMLGEYVCAYTAEQREYREGKIERGVGARPAYRINIRFHDKNDIFWRRHRAAEKQLAIYESTLARARAEGHDL